MVFASDFETTGEQNLERDGYVRVWLWSLVDIETGYKWYGTNIESWFKKVENLACDVIYFHNLKFDGRFIVDYLSRNNEYMEDYTVLIDENGSWYQIMLKFPEFTTKIWDSLKKFPGTSVESLAKMYGIEGKKEKPYFDEYRPIDYKPTLDEIDYCLQDSLIVAHAIKDVYSKGYKRMTLSSDAFKSVKSYIGKDNFRKYMPKLELEDDDFIRKAYRGGWTYLNPKYAGVEVDNVRVYDVNSLYPWVMKYCKLPVGKPQYREPLTGELYVIKFDTIFEIKPGYLPTIQIKGFGFIDTEYLTSSDGIVTLTLTNVDLDLFFEHYNVYLFTNITYACFDYRIGLLGEYIDYWTDVKIQSKKNNDSAMYYISKRWLNSPYGKTATKVKHRNKIPFLDNETDKVKYMITEEIGQPIYVPYGVFVTAWARDKTIRTAQQCYENFIYADTDSVHVNGSYEPTNVDDYRLGAWKLESQWDKGKYLRSKTYMHADKDYNVQEVKACGAPDALKGDMTWENFQFGAEYTGKLLPKTVPGGCVLAKTTFKIMEACEWVIRRCGMIKVYC